ncbi:hypothetical protein CBL_01788 [Carabus blaptoides fortunei]
MDAPAEFAIAVHLVTNQRVIRPEGNKAPGMKTLMLTLDTDATHSIIRPNLAGGNVEPLAGYKLRTATGEEAVVLGKGLDREKAKKMLEKYVSIFANEDNKFGRTSLVKHQIYASDAKPIRKPRAGSIPFGFGCFWLHDHLDYVVFEAVSK